MITPGDWSRGLAVIAEWHTPVGPDGLRHVLVRPRTYEAYHRVLSYGHPSGIRESDSERYWKNSADKAIFFILSLFPYKEDGQVEWEIWDLLYSIESSGASFATQRHGSRAPSSFDDDWEHLSVGLQQEYLPRDPITYCLLPSASKILGAGEWLMSHHLFWRTKDASAPSGRVEEPHGWIAFAPPDVETFDAEVYRLLGVPTPWLAPEEEFETWYREEVEEG